MGLEADGCYQAVATISSDHMACWLAGTMESSRPRMAQANHVTLTSWVRSLASASVSVNRNDKFPNSNFE
jgi:hypothetical protein